MLQQMLASAAEKGAEAVLAKMGVQTPMNLDNSTAQLQNTPLTEGETSMALKRIRVKIGTKADGTPKYKYVQGKSQDELNDNIANTLKAYREESFSSLPPEKSIKITTFKEYTEKWFLLYCKNKTKQTTQVGYRSYLKIHLYPTFGDLPISDISTGSIQLFLNERSLMARKTLKHIKNLLSMILDSAVEDELIVKNPALSKRLNIPSSKEEHRDALKEVDIKDIMNNINRLTEKDRLLIAILIFTGMRRGEVLGLRWEDIDLSSGFIHVKRNATFPNSNQAVITTPKSIKGFRSIPIISQLKPYLTSEDGKGFVIGGNEKPLSQQQYINTLIRINKAINLHGATVHILRHSFLTEVSNAGCEAKMVQAVGGHADVAFTLNRYVHSQDEQLLRTGEKIGRMFDSL